MSCSRKNLMWRGAKSSEPIAQFLIGEHHGRRIRRAELPAAANSSGMPAGPGRTRAAAVTIVETTRSTCNPPAVPASPHSGR